MPEIKQVGELYLTRTVLHAATEILHVSSGVSSSPVQYLVTERLKDNTRIAIRPIRPDDEPLMVTFHTTLSEQSVYMRYFTPVELSRRVTHERLVRVCGVDHKRDVVLVAIQEIPQAHYREIIGVARLTSCLPTENDQSEFALIISDRYQRQGLGSILLRQILQVAQEQGRHQIIAYILPENHGMQIVCERLGFSIIYDSNESLLQATIHL